MVTSMAGRPIAIFMFVFVYGAFGKREPQPFHCTRPPLKPESPVLSTSPVSTTDQRDDTAEMKHSEIFTTKTRPTNSEPPVMSISQVSTTDQRSDTEMKYSEALTTKTRSTNSGSQVTVATDALKMLTTDKKSDVKTASTKFVETEDSTPNASSEEKSTLLKITCPQSALPTVEAGLFNCSGYSVGEVCNLTCNDGYYPSESLEIACEEHDFRGIWTDGNFQCSAEFQEQFVFTVLPIADCPEQDTLIQLFIATVAENVGAEGLVFFPLQNISEIFFNLSPGVGEFLNLPVMALPRKSTGSVRRRENSTVVVAATAETVVYVHVRCSQQKDSNPKSGSVRGTAFQIKGIRELGKYYRVLTFQKCGHAQVAIVAVKETTVVEIYMNDTNVTEHDNIALQMYETYIIEGKFDMTGAYIQANEPVFVLTGNDGDGMGKCACSSSSNSTSSSNSSRGNSSNSENTPTNSCGRGKDPFYECLIPYHHWGTHYYLFPLFDTLFTMVYKIISFENMKVTITEGQESANNLSLDGRLGKFIEKTVTCSQTQGGVEIKSPEAILVAQLSVQSERSVSMLLATPSSQFTRRYTVFPVFNISHVDKAATHYINIILPSDGLTNDLHINNDSTSTWENVGNFTDGSRVVRTILSPGSNLLENRGGYNITAVVSASHVRRSYTFALP